MENHSVVLTIPISPPQSDKPGIFSLCCVADILRSKTGSEGAICFNVIDGYNDRIPAAERLEKAIDQFSLSDTKIWRDDRHQEHILRNLQILIEQGHVFVEDTVSLVCPCGRVDCKKESLEDIKEQKLFQERGEEIICVSCEGGCEESRRRALVFRVPDIAIGVESVPDYLAKEIQDLHKDFKGRRLMISKSRSTNLSFEYRGENYNLDNDFCSFNFLAAFEGDEKAIVATSHVKYQMFMIALLEKLCNPKTKVVLAPIAYIRGASELDIHDPDLTPDQKRHYLMAAFNLAKETSWPQGELRYLRNKSDQLLGMIHSSLVAKSSRRDGENWHQYIMRILKHEMRISRIKPEQTRIFKESLSRDRV